MTTPKVVKIGECIGIDKAIQDGFRNILNTFKKYEKDFLRSKKLNFHYMKEILPIICQKLIEMDENFEDLKNIVDAVKNHLPKEASRFAENHVRRFNIRMGNKSMEADKQNFFENSL